MPLPNPIPVHGLSIVPSPSPQLPPQVSFGLELDVYDLCSPELKALLDGPRAALKAHQDRLLEQKKLAGKPPAAAEAGAGAGAPAAADVEMADTASASTSDGHVGAITGEHDERVRLGEMYTRRPCMMLGWY